MRIVPAVALLAMLTITAATAQTGPSSGIYVGDIADGQTEHRHYTTHGDNPCLAIYIPHVYTVTVETDPSATLQIGVGTKAATTSNGLATLSFTANYCTAFNVAVQGLDVRGGIYGDAAPYTVTVTHVLAGPGLAIA